MREILFRAKAINRDKGYHRTNYKNGDWVYGLITRLYDERFENLPAEMTDENGVSGIEIDHNTICQYTGLTDKNGCKIWEGDVVEFEDTGEEGYEYKEGFDFINKARVEFAEARWSLTDFASTNSAVVDEVYNHVEFMDFWQYCKVIGNIFDNADLLGE